MLIRDWPNAKVRFPSPGAASSAPASVENDFTAVVVSMPPQLNLGTIGLLRCCIPPLENKSDRAPREAVVSLLVVIAAREKILLNTTALMFAYQSARVSYILIMLVVFAMYSTACVCHHNQ